MVNVETSAFKSIEVTDESGKILRVDEGDTVVYATETGEEITGKLTKIIGKREKTKIQIVPQGGQKEEIWSVLVMAEGSLNVVEDAE